MAKPWRAYQESLVSRGLEPALAHNLIWAAIHTKSLKVVSLAAMAEDQILDGQIDAKLIFDAVDQALSAPLIITSPVGGLQDVSPVTLQAFKMIVAAADERLSIISPYIDDAGVQQLADPIRSAAERNVAIRLLTREIDAHQPFRVRGLATLASLSRRRLSVRDYHTRAPGLGHVTSVHAKLLLADDRLGYVGSAELRGNALEKNFEMGAILRDRAAVEAAAAFEAVWQLAKVV